MSKQTDWFLQLWDTNWVVWGYGPQRTEGFGYIDPAQVVIKVEKEWNINIPFELKTDGFDTAQEYSRVRRWGWRFKTKDLVHNTCWELAESRLEAVVAAASWAKEYSEHKASSNPDMTFLHACDDARELGDVVDLIGQILTWS